MQEQARNKPPKIVAPVSSPDEVRPLIRAGADELYCGMDRTIRQPEYRNLDTRLNRADDDFWNLWGRRELAAVCRLAGRENTPVYLTVDLAYPQSAYPLALERCMEGIEAGVSGIIVGDLGLLTELASLRTPLKLVAGGGLAAFNAGAVEFAASLGADRVVLSDQLSAEEMAAIASSAAGGVELEAAVLNDRCLHVNGSCGWSYAPPRRKRGAIRRLGSRWAKRAWNKLPHRLLRILTQRTETEAAPCRAIFWVNALEPRFGKADICPSLMTPMHRAETEDACGICALHRIAGGGVGYVKILGRGRFRSRKLQDVRFVKASLDLLESRPDAETFAHQARALFARTFESPCNGRRCYYPSEQYLPEEK